MRQSDDISRRRRISWIGTTRSINAQYILNLIRGIYSLLSLKTPTQTPVRLIISHRTHQIADRKLTALTRRFRPLIHSAASLARKPTTGAISSTSPSRPAGANFAVCSITWGGLPARKSGVSTGPGDTVFTVIPLPPSAGLSRGCGRAVRRPLWLRRR